METNDNIIDVSYVDTYVFKKEDYKFIKEFTYRETLDHIYLKSYIGTSSEVVIPDTFKDKPITFVDKGFFDECKVPITSLSLGDNLISFSAKIKNIKTLNKIRLGKKINCIENLFKETNILEVDLGNNHNYKFYEGCLLSCDGKNLIWNQPWIKKVPENVEVISTSCQFYDSIYLPSTILQVHADSFKTRNMVIYYGGGKLEWTKVKFVKTLTPRDLKKGIFDNELQGKSLQHKFKKIGKKINFEIKFKYLGRK